MMMETSGRSVTGRERPARSALLSGRLTSGSRLGPNVLRFGGGGAPGGDRNRSNRSGLRLSAERANRSAIRAETGRVAALRVIKSLRLMADLRGRHGRP